MRHQKLQIETQKTKAEKYQWSLNDNIKQSDILAIRVMKREEKSNGGEKSKKREEKGLKLQNTDKGN